MQDLSTQTTTFFALLNQPAITIYSAELSKSMQVAGLMAQPVHVVLQGKYQSLRQLFWQFAKQPMLISINHFSIEQLAKKQFQLTLNVLLFNVLIFNSIYHPLSFNERSAPFCLMENHGSLHHDQDNNQLQKTSLNTINMVGFMQNQAQTQALLWLPSHKIVAVKIGDVIAKERWLVTNIQKNFVQVVLGQQQQKIKMKG
ncbi:MAG: hypothetical protein ACD_46C00709G0003 [uncultured bacterium]|nr:MAG: hypothetical protein ACD_46C00709G0003 [uncultured bacterium]